MTTCPWFCEREQRCHANACSDLWGGQLAAPCGHLPTRTATNDSDDNRGDAL